MLERFKVRDEVAIRIAPDAMRATVENLFRAVGMPNDDAVQAVDVLMYADIRGVDSHGVSNMTRIYLQGFENGRINPKPQWKIERDMGAAVTIDSDQGLGLVVGPAAMDIAIDRAKKHGVGVGIAFNGQHSGAMAYHAQRALAHDMIGISMTTGGVMAAPTNGAEKLLGLNPIGIAVPAEKEPPFIFDAAMSSVPNNKIRLLQRTGGQVLPGMIADADGTPIMEESPVPEDYLLLPLGGTRAMGSPKGFGLIMLVETLTTLLAGTGAGPDRRGGMAHFFMALDVNGFFDAESLKQDMDAYLSRFTNCKVAPGEDRVVYPGVLEQEAEVDRLENGIPYHPEVIDWFTTTCESLQVEHFLES